jgi:hypothetical protein
VNHGAAGPEVPRQYYESGRHHFSTLEMSTEICGAWDRDLRDRKHLNLPKIYAKAFNKKMKWRFSFVGL